MDKFATKKEDANGSNNCAYTKTGHNSSFTSRFANKLYSYNPPVHTKKPLGIFNTIESMTTSLAPALKKKDERQSAFAEVKLQDSRSFEVHPEPHTDSIEVAINKISLKDDKDSFTKLNNMCISFYKSLTCDAQNNYKTTLQIDSVEYVGVGNCSEEANENAAKLYFHSIKDKEVEEPSLNDNSSFAALSKMFPDIIFNVVGPDEKNHFRALIQIDFVHYYGSADTIEAAKEVAAEACLLSIKYGWHLNSQFLNY